jgi:hypothetical protein
LLKVLHKPTSVQSTKKDPEISSFLPGIGRKEIKTGIIEMEL